MKNLIFFYTHTQMNSIQHLFRKYSNVDSNDNDNYLLLIGVVRIRIFKTHRQPTPTHTHTHTHSSWQRQYCPSSISYANKVNPILRRTIPLTYLCWEVSWSSRRIRWKRYVEDTNDVEIVSRLIWWEREWRSWWVRKHMKCSSRPAMMSWVRRRCTSSWFPCSEKVSCTSNSRVSLTTTHITHTPLEHRYDAPPKIRRQQFRFLGTGLRGRRLKSYVPLLVKEAQDFFAKWGDSGEVDILDKLSELTILTASRCLMGQEVREKLFEEVAGLFHTLDKGITPLSVFWPHAPVPSHWARDRARKEMVKLLSGVIQKKREEIKKDPEGDHGDDMLAYLVTVKYKDGRLLTVHEIVGFFIALLFAGQHTSSITATWTTLFLAHHPDVLSRVMAEQDEILSEIKVEDVTYVVFERLCSSFCHNRYCI